MLADALTRSPANPSASYKKAAMSPNIMRTIDRFARYGGRMGVYNQWHPFIFPLMHLIAPAGAAVAAIHSIAAQVIRELGPREAEKPSTDGNAAGAVAAAEQDTSLRNDYIRSLLARHCTNPAAFAVGDIYYHTVPHVIAGGETTGIALAAAVYFLPKQPRVLAKLRGELDAYTASERKAEGLWRVKTEWFVRPRGFRARVETRERGRVKEG